MATHVEAPREAECEHTTEASASALPSTRDVLKALAEQDLVMIGESSNLVPFYLACRHALLAQTVERTAKLMLDSGGRGVGVDGDDGAGSSKGVTASRSDRSYFQSRQHLLRRRNLAEQKRRYRDADYLSRHARSQAGMGIGTGMGTGAGAGTAANVKAAEAEMMMIGTESETETTDSRVADFMDYSGAGSVAKEGSRGSSVAGGIGHGRGDGGFGSSVNGRAGKDVTASPVASSLAAPPLTELSEFAARSGREPVSKAYSFSGLFHVFSHNTDAVTCVEFAHDKVDLLAFGSMDTTVSVVVLGREIGSEPKIQHVLSGHTKQVNSISWSQDNERLVSCSTDCTSRVWDVASGDCLRLAHFDCPVNTARFFPMNDNLLLVGTEGDGVILFNLSTGKPKQTLRVGGVGLGMGMGMIGMRRDAQVVTALETDASGTLLFVGTANGVLCMFSASGGALSFARVAEMKVALSLTHAHGSSHSRVPGQGAGSRSGSGSSSGSGAGQNSITSIRFSEWQTGVRHPTLLVNVRGTGSRAGQILVVGLADHTQGRKGKGKGKASLSFVIERQYPNAHQHYSVCSRFCPLISHRSGVCVVTGSEDTSVYVLNITRKEGKPKGSGSGSGTSLRGNSSVVNRLEGHNAPVLDVAWNHDESLLASTDASGVVILWKRKEVERVVDMDEEGEEEE